MSLPVATVLPELVTALAAGRVAVLVAPPGAGKTTQVPLALLDQPWLGDQRIVMLEPRRLAARAAASRMASLLGERTGETVGYRMRLDTRVGPRTRIEVVTEGVLTRMLQHDLALEGVGLVIFDEFHERSLAADTGLALTMAAAESLRDDLRILVMSATLDAVAVSDLLGNAPVIESHGRAWPVDTRYAPPRAGVSTEAHVAAVVRDALHAEPGSVLVFLPGAREIRRVQQSLAGSADDTLTVHALHGSLPPGEQDAAIAPARSGMRKVVLATSIAETSLTIEGIRMVIDSGLMRLPRFSPRTGMTRLETMRVSRASADQRRGRAGRTEAGVCIRCWSAADDAGLVPQTRAEILDADLAPLLLELASAGFADPHELRWLDPPPAAALSQARALLQMLGALDERGRITAHGRALTELAGHPRLAHMVVRATASGTETWRTACALAALLEERDPLRGAAGPPMADISLRLDAMARDADDMMLAGATVDRGLVARIGDGAAEWRRRTGVANRVPQDSLSAGALLAFAYPDRIAQRRDGAGRFLLRNGRGASLPLTDSLAHQEWIVAANIDDTGRDARITLAAAVTLEELRETMGDQPASEDHLEWDAARRRVVATRRLMLGALTLSESIRRDVDPDAARAVMRDVVRRDGVDVISWTGAARALRARLAFLHEHVVGWPDVGHAAVLDLLSRAIDAMSRPSLDDIDLADMLLGTLTWEQRAALDQLAPERVAVPSGSRVLIDYSDPAAPVLAVRLQEVFGMGDTPRIARGTVAITMQLLSPARRPVQVTRDLASFWKEGYFDVRKDLRGRYPRHHWPDDPLRAEAVRGVKRRK